MKTYEITLTAAQIEILKRALSARENELFQEIENERAETGQVTNTVIKYCKSEKVKVSALYTNLCYQLSDQQKPTTPLSLREYPQ
jgi:hypothetical protein